MIKASVTAQIAGADGSSAVPEPGMGLIGVGLVFALTRRKAKRGAAGNRSLGPERLIGSQLWKSDLAALVLNVKSRPIE